jgi:phosphotransferase system HPr (HPr) family protein
LPHAESAPIVVEAEHGIHARPAAALADTARRFKSTITISGASGRSADAKSVVALLGLEIERGDAIRITARGLDANEAKEALESAAGKAFGLAENQAATRTAVAPRPILPAQPEQEEAGIFRGVSASPALAVGRVARLLQPVVKVKEYGADATVERNKLHEAVAVTRSELDAEAAAAGNGQSEILVAHRILLEDPQLLTEAENWIGQGKSAGWAWQTAAHGCAERIKSLKSGVLAGRAADIPRPCRTSY